jgi:hypothetical protein
MTSVCTDPAGHGGRSLPDGRRRGRAAAVGNRSSVDGVVAGDMTPDPAEGMAGDGIIGTGASKDNLHPADAGLLDETVGMLRAALGAALHSVYVYGSVATGQACPPRSDLDVVVVTTADLDRGVDELAGELTDRHRGLVREVGIGSVSLQTLRRNDLIGRAERCFLKHYCVHLAGPDVRGEFVLYIAAVGQIRHDTPGRALLPAQAGRGQDPLRGRCAAYVGDCPMWSTANWSPTRRRPTKPARTRPGSTRRAREGNGGRLQHPARPAQPPQPTLRTSHNPDPHP